MKTVSVREIQKKIKECIDLSQKDRVVVTRHGQPAAVVIGVEGMDWENVVLETDPLFWKLIQNRRKQPTLSLETLKTRLLKK